MVKARIVHGEYRLPDLNSLELKINTLFVPCDLGSSVSPVTPSRVPMKWSPSGSIELRMMGTNAVPDPDSTPAPHSNVPISDMFEKIRG
jgi:hypothetical protein